MEIVLTAEIAAAIAALENVQQKQLPFATSLAVNRTALDAQGAVRGHVRQAFTLRKEQFVLQRVKIEKGDFSTKRFPSAFRVKIDNAKGREFLAKFESDGIKKTLDPTFPVAIPSTHARPQFNALVPRNLFPTALRLVPTRGVVGSYTVSGGDGKTKKRRIFGALPAKQRRTRRGVLQWTGKRGTFVLDPREHRGIKTWGVYQRTGPGEDDVRLLWTYKMQVPIPRNLLFRITVIETVDRRFHLNFTEAYARAIATAK